MKKLLIMSIALVAIMATVFTVSAFAANTVTIDGVTLAKYGEKDTYDDAYLNVTVNYTVTEDTAGAVDRLTFYLAAQDLNAALEGEEAKVIYIDEQVEADAGSITFTIEKKRVRTAFTAAGKIDSEADAKTAYASLFKLYDGETNISPFVMTFKLGGANVDVADSETVVFTNPVMYGDANCNGSIAANDATLILRKGSGLTELNVERTMVGDTNGNGAVAANDATGVLRYGATLWSYDDILSRHNTTWLEK